MSVRIWGVRGIPLIQPNDDLITIIASAIADNDISLEDGDIVAIAQKIVSKSEGRQVTLDTITPTREATELGEEVEKDPRLVELILRESTEVVRKKPGVLITRHRLGHVGANSGIDQSNIEHGSGDCVLLLPVDPDASARRIQKGLARITGKKVSTLITDSANRPWRLGTIGFAIGAANLKVLDDRRGGEDLYGRELKVTMTNRADSIATAATLVMGETTEAVPVAIVQGLPVMLGSESASISNRPLEEDLFR